MAYSSVPVVSTYSSHQLPGSYDINIRDYYTKINSFAATTPFVDDGMINLIPRKENKTLVSEIRPQILGQQVANSAGAARGIYVWQKTSALTYYFTVVGTKIYTATSATSGWANVTTFSAGSTSPTVGFTEFINSATNTKSLVVVDGQEGYIFTSNAAGTKITDADFPTPHIANPIYLDGYLFLAKKDTGDIYNSDLNDASSWTAGSFISSELYPDDVKGLAKVNNYLLAIGSAGCEFFYDAANALASPMARIDGQSLPFGTIVPSSIAANKDTVAMICNNNDGECTIQLINGFKNVDITPEWFQVFVPITDYTNIRGFFLRTRGDLLYVLSLPGGSPFGLTNYSFPVIAYSTATQTWIQLQGNAGFSTVGNEVGFPVTCSCAGTSNDTISFIGGASDSQGSFTPFFGTFGESNFMDTGALGTIQNAPIDQYFDASGNSLFNRNIPTRIRTTLEGYGTLNNKTMSRFGISFLPDQNSGNYTFYISWGGLSDAGGSRTITTSNTNGISDYPFVTQLGIFRERAFTVDYIGTRWLKYRYFEVDINKAQK